MMSKHVTYLGRCSRVILALFFIIPASANAMRDQLVLSMTTSDGTQHQLPAIAYSHEIAPEIDQASGLPTGKRQHKPMTLTKAVDTTSPIVFNILTNNENITSWKLKIFRTSPQGSTRLFKTVELVGADVCGTSNTLSTADMHEREHVSFCYQKILWTWEDGGITAEDDWETPVAAQ